MGKRLLSILLVMVTLLTALPPNFIAAASERNTIKYGDANGDGSIDLRDDLMLRRYLAEQNPSGFNTKNADTNGDGKVDLKDILVIKKYLAGWAIALGPVIKDFIVTFYDGDKVIDKLTAKENEPLGAIPAVGKSSKANSILVGYYLDKEFTKPFYAENPVTENINVYAKYEEMEKLEELTFTSFTKMDQDKNVTFSIKKVSGALLPDEAVTLIPKDGSDPVELKITDEDGDGVYTVKAPDGFKEGASYELTLEEGWNFDGKEDSVRTAAFTIAIKEVENLQMNEDIIYIQDTDALKYVVGNATLDVLKSDDIDNLPEAGGTFVYADANKLETNDILCIYVGKNPNERDSKNGKELLDPVVYVKVSKINGTTVTFIPLGENDQQGLYEIPDNFPIIVPALPTGNEGTVNFSGLDLEVYKMMMGEDATKESALAAISVGDFISLYVSNKTVDGDENVYYGKITKYDAATGVITYVKSSAEEIEHCMDLYVDTEVSGDDIITDEEKAEIEQTVQAQLDASNFAEEAAFLLAELITQTDGFRNNQGIRDFIIKDANGNELTDEQIALLNLGGSFELSDDIKLKAELIKKGDQLHFKGGVQLAISIDAEFEVEVEDDGLIKISLSASFVEEVAIDPKVSGEIVKKKILGIPIPTGVKVGSNIDVRNYTAFSFEAQIYTVEKEDQGKWETIKDIMNNPTEIIDAALPAEFAGALNTVGDVMSKIEELNNKIDKANEAVEKIEKYQNDVAALWAVIEEQGVTTKEAWEQMEEELGKTSVASDLLGLMDMTTETGITTEYLSTFQELMDKYSETVQKETDWVKLVEKEMFAAEVNICGVVIGIGVDFVVRMDMSIAIGSNLEYEVGKRYNFWFKIGLFKPSSGSSTMDLIDERFAFQFYVMGRLGLRAGIEAEFYVGLGTGKFASVGITAELGPYIKMYGFFVYEYTKYRPANTRDWTETERMAGGLFMEFGLYFILGFEAEALGLFEYSHDFLDEEIPLLTAGEQKYYYDFIYEPEEGEMVVVRDADGNSTNGITAQLRDSLIAMDYLDLKTGYQGEETVDYSRYNFSFSNSNFSMDEKTGVITVNVPENTRIMECDLIVTYKYGKVAFSQFDMTVTIPLVWTNLSDAELKEFYSASVRVGNDAEGYETVWSKRVLKNQQYDLPTVDEIKELIGWNEYKYVEGTGYGNQSLEGLTLIEDKVYDFHVYYKQYSINVDGIQNPDGTTTSKTFYAKYGEAFDFSDLVGTGTAQPGKKYTTFAGVETTATITVNGEKEVIDLSRPINAKVAEALTAEGGIKATANYIDTGIKVNFTFVGREHDDVEMLVNRGETPDLEEIEEIALQKDLGIKDISPVVNKVYAPVTYEVLLGVLTGPSATIKFEENGGAQVSDITKVVGSYIGKLPTPVKDGYTFEGWYTDNGTFLKAFDAKKVPEGGATVYAKWKANEYIVSFHVNGGNALAETDASKKVTFDQAYSTFPTVTKNGYGFIGWFTAAEGGVQVKETDLVKTASNQTLYAQWKELKQIPNSVFDFGEAESGTYEKCKTHEVKYTFTAQNGESYKLEDFTFKYMKQGASDYAEGLPVGAGTYNVTISRPADNDYAKFEYTYTAVITIAKAVRELDNVAIEAVNKGYTSIEFKLTEGTIDDLSPEAELSFIATYASDKHYSEDGVVKYLRPNVKYQIVVAVKNDPNYEDATSKNSVEMTTKDAPTDSWLDEGNYDISWFDPEKESYEISTAAQLAGLSYITKNSDERMAFVDKTVYLTADIDLSGHEWKPINYFFGSFDGNNHVITGMYIKQPGSYDQGLFGRLSVDTIKDMTQLWNISATISNIRIEDSYVHGLSYVGGIVGRVEQGSRLVLAGTIYTFRYVLTINNCVSDAVVHAEGSNSNNDYSASSGGIVGYLRNGDVNNCVNYGKVTGDGYHVGGIVGYNAEGEIRNSVNYGTIKGTSACVGGVVGESYEDEGSAGVYNCVNIGSVTGSKEYIGAIVGRNYKDRGTVNQCYYLRYSAKATKDSNERKALGTEKGALADGDEGTKTSNFNADTLKLARDCGYGTDLLNALNDCVETFNKDSETFKLTLWEKGLDGYPVHVGLRK